MAITGTATRSATTQAAVNAVNQQVAEPASERYPGAVNPAQYGPGSYAPAGSPAGPVAYPGPPDPFGATLPHQAPGGGVQDAAWLTGHDGPSIPWDSSAGQPFAGSGAINPELHGEDTGGVFVKAHVIPASIGQLFRRVMTGQTTVRMSGDQVTRDNQTGPNGRADYDQQQWHNPDGHDPWAIPYAERPVLNNVAYQPVATTDPGTAYGVAGGLPDRSTYPYGALAYEAPPDPSVPPPAASSQAQDTTAGIGGGWV